MSSAPQLIDIVPGGPGDLTMVNMIMGEAFDPCYGEAWTPSQCLGMLALPGVWFCIAWSGGKPAGFAMARGIADEAELLLLAVRPAMRRRGVGAGLLRAIIADARERGMVKLHLEVRANNVAVHLYRTQGFEKIGERRDYYRGNAGKLFDAWTFSRNID